MLSLWLVHWKHLQNLTEEEKEFIENNLEQLDSDNSYNLEREDFEALRKKHSGNKKLKSLFTLLDKLLSENDDMVSVAMAW